MTILGSFSLVPNSLYYGDCLEVMGGWPAESVDLIYLDPPFNSKADYNQLFGTENGVPAQVRAFTDTWTWNDSAAERYDRFSRAVAHPAHKAVVGLHMALGPSGMLAYLTYMAERLAECKRLLKPTGSIYLHCDHTAGAYLKMLMDAIFGANNRRSELHWYYYNKMHDSRKKLFAAATDTIFFYVKDVDSGFSFEQLQERREKPVKQLVRAKVNGRMVNKRDEDGRLMYQTKTHRTIDNVWRIPCLQPASRERLGYPTQKPRALLDRIIKASSREGDLVLDPFCGCGTTIDAANRLQRQWVGIDLSPFATRLVRDRRLKDASIQIFGIPTDVEGARLLLRNNPFDFEAWIVTSVDGLAANEVQVGDGGIDGRGRMFTVPDDETGLVLAQVKGGVHRIGAAGLRGHDGPRERHGGHLRHLEARHNVQCPRGCQGDGRVPRRRDALPSAPVLVRRGVSEGRPSSPTRDGRPVHRQSSSDRHVHRIAGRKRCPRSRSATRNTRRCTKPSTAALRPRRSRLRFYATVQTHPKPSRSVCHRRFKPTPLSSLVYNPHPEMMVAHAMVVAATENYCEEHGGEFLDRLDFSQLATATATAEDHEV